MFGDACGDLRASVSESKLSQDTIASQIQALRTRVGEEGLTLGRRVVLHRRRLQRQHTRAPALSACATRPPPAPLIAFSFILRIVWRDAMRIRRCSGRTATLPRRVGFLNLPASPEDDLLLQVQASSRSMSDQNLGAFTRGKLQQLGAPRECADAGAIRISLYFQGIVGDARYECA